VQKFGSQRKARRQQQQQQRIHPRRNLIVVIILGILAAIVVANVGTASEDSRRGAFITSLKTFMRLEAGFRAQSGDYLEDASSGVCPAGFDRFINPDGWGAATPIGGGVWDSERDEYGIISAIGVHFNGIGVTHDDARLGRGLAGRDAVSRGQL
jgi:type II secretory pathway pseudopilin PulG